MKIRLLIDNIDLELPDNLTISVVENSGLFDSEYLYGNIVYNINIINTPRNAQILQNPHIINRAGREWQEFADCQLIIFGKLKSVGTLCLTTIAKDQFTGILRDTNMDLLKLLRDKKFKDFDGVANLTTLDELTVLYENDGSFKKKYETTDKYCLFPVYNPNFYADRGKAHVIDDTWRDYEDIHVLNHKSDLVPGKGNRNMLNFAEHDADYSYIINAINEYCLNPIVPSVFAKHLLDMIGRYVTYTIVFDSSIPSAFNYLAIFSNYDIATPAFVKTETNTKMNFTNPVSFKVSTIFQTTGLKEFILAFMGLTNSYMKINKIAHTITFYTKESIIDSKDTWDVSQKTINLQLNKHDEKGIKFTYEINEDSAFAGLNDLNEDIDLWEGDYNLLSDPYPADYANKGKFYYDLFKDSLYRCIIKDDDEYNLIPRVAFNCYNRLVGLQYGSEPYLELSLKMLPLLLNHSIYSSENMLFFDWKPCPYTLTPGNSSYFDEFISDDVLRALFYYFDGGLGRGVHELDGQSLVLRNSDNGIYDNLYRRWLYFLWKKASFTSTVMMSEKEFNEFDIYRKLKIQESQAIIETITITVHNQKGITGANVTAHFLPSDWSQYASSDTGMGENDVRLYYELTDSYEDETGTTVCPNMANGLRPLSISTPQPMRYNLYNGSDNYKDFSGQGNFGLSDFTICLNIKFVLLDSTIRYVMEHGGTTTTGWRLEASTTYGLCFVVGGVRMAAINYSHITAGKWYIIIVKGDRDGNISIELDYNNIATEDFSACEDYNLSSPLELRFGGNLQGDGNFFQGGINNTMIVHRLLSDAEITGYKDAYEIPADAVLYDKCDETAGAFNSLPPFQAMVFGTLTDFYQEFWGAEITGEQFYILKQSWQNSFGYTLSKEGMYYDPYGSIAIPVGTLIPRDESNPIMCCAYDVNGNQLYLNRRGKVNQGLIKLSETTFMMYATPYALALDSFWFDEFLNPVVKETSHIKALYDPIGQWDEENQRFFIIKT